MIFDGLLFLSMSYVFSVFSICSVEIITRRQQINEWKEVLWKLMKKHLIFEYIFFSIHEKITACAINAIHVQLHTFQLIFFFNFWNLCPSTALPIVMFNYDVTMGKNTQSNIKKNCLTSDIHLVLNQTCDKLKKKSYFYSALELK